MFGFNNNGWTEDQVKSLVNEYTMRYQGVYGVFPLEEEVLEFVQERTKYPVDGTSFWFNLFTKQEVGVACKTLYKMYKHKKFMHYTKGPSGFLRLLDGLEAPTPIREELGMWKSIIS